MDPVANFFSVNGQIENISDFVWHMVSVRTTKFDCYNMKAVIDKA